MAIAVTTDLVMISNCDSTKVIEGSPGVWSAGTIDTDAKVEGAACLYVKYTSSGAKEVTFTPTTNLNLTNTCIYFWVGWASKSMPNTKALGGLAIRLYTDATHWSEWLVAGNDTLPHNGWVCHIVDTSTTPDTTGTYPVTINNVDIIYLKANLLKAGNFYWDVFRYGTLMTITGGDSTTPATFADMLATDVANAYGFISLSEGVYFLQGAFQIGTTTASTPTYFKDTSKVLAFTDKNVVASRYTITVVGNASGTDTTKVYLGTKSGTQGISGCVFKPAGATKYIITATNEDIDDLGLYGCSFIDAGTISLPTYSATREVLNCNFEGCAEILPDTCTMTYCNIISSDDRGLRIVASHHVTNCSFIGCPRAIHIPSAGTYSFDYMNFTVNIYDIDNSSGGTVTVNSSNSTSPPSTYINSVVDNQENNDTDNSFGGTTTRVGQLKTISNKKVVRLSHFLKKFGSPTGNVTFTVRKVSDDSVLQSIVLSDASILTTTNIWYEKEFVFPPTISESIRLCVEHTGDVSNYIIARRQNSDVKADEYLCSYEGAWFFNQSNDYAYKALLHDSTVTTSIINTVYLTVDVEDEAGNPVIGAAVYIEKASDKTVLMNELTVLTSGKGRAQADYNYAPPPFAINVRVRKSTVGGTRYVPISTTGEVGANGYTLTAVLIVDTNII